MGSGGREHALAWKIAQSKRLTELHAAPGNPGIAALGRCHPISVDDVEGLLGLSRQHEIDLVVVGPEAPLVAGVADQLRRAGVAVFGPSKAAARIEGSKAFAKEVLAAAEVPTAAALDEARAPCVVKADGLAAGKGVFVCRTQEELDAGAWKVITEAREGGTAGIFDSSGGMRTELIGEIALEVGPVNVIFEAPSKAAQVWFITQFGPSVNLGNIPPDEVIPLETLRLGLRGDTLKEVLLGERAGAS